MKLGKKLRQLKIASENMEKHFVLVHGACLGAWTWYKVVALLKSHGHKVTALDMAASGIDPRSVDDVQSAADYSEPLLEFMAALPPGGKVVLLGHSLGGVCISLAMEKFPHKIAVAVFLAAFMPCPGIDMDDIYEKYKRPMDFYMDCKIEYLNGYDKPPTSLLFGPKYMSTKLLQLSPPEDVELASLLIRPTPCPVQGTFSEQSSVTKENYGSVTRVYLKPENDNLINEPIEKFRLENYPPAQVKIIPKSDHMAMFSNPTELAASLLQIVDTYT